MHIWGILSAMSIRLLTSAEDLALYRQWISTHPDATLWQSLEWKTYQEALGRTVKIYAAFEANQIIASALVVIDATTGGFSTWDIQRGPLVAMKNEKLKIENLMEKILTDAKQNKCISVFLSPIRQLSIINYQLSIRHEQPEATRILDISVSDEEILKQMHQKGRYNIKVAEKNGIRIEESSDVEAYAKLSSDTAKRDGFIGGSVKRYKAFLENIPGSFLLLAYTSDHHSPIAGLIGVSHGKAGTYYYGASDYDHRALMAPYLLQWEAIKHCKKVGCQTYDLLGIAPPNTANHPWSGISDFKAKFGGDVILYPCEQEIVLRPVVRGILRLKRRVMG